jgi:putative transcriptional regulator
MSKAFKSIKAGLTEAIAHAKGKKVAARVHYPRALDVKAIRAKVGMTQTEFASSFGISVGTLRHWERGDRDQGNRKQCCRHWQPETQLRQRRQRSAPTVPGTAQGHSNNDPVAPCSRTLRPAPSKT